MQLVYTVKPFYISVPLMLAKLAMRYHSLTLNFVVAKSNVYCYACAVVCHAVTKVENGVLPCTAGCKKEISRPFCCEVVMTHVLVHLRKIGAWSKYVRANTNIMTLSASQNDQARMRIRKQVRFCEVHPRVGTLWKKPLRYCLPVSAPIPAGGKAPSPRLYGSPSFSPFRGSK